VSLYQSSVPDNRESLGQLVRSEWTKLRSVRSWKFTIFLALALTVGLAVVTGTGSHSSINGVAGHPYVPTGPGGESVTDSFFFVQQPLTGNGSITARVSSLVGAAPGNSVRCAHPHRHPVPPRVRHGGGRQVIPCRDTVVAGGPTTTVQAWSKAGLIVKAGDTQGSAYAAVMVTPGHGTRMQWNYVNDVAGDPGTATATSPRWLRLTRSGDTLTGYDSTDGHNWTEINSVTLAGLPSTVDIGLFVTSPQSIITHGRDAFNNPTFAEAAFDHVTLDGARTGATWHGLMIGGNSAYPVAGGAYGQARGVFTISGSGDIAPAAIGGPGGIGQALDLTLVGGFLGLLVLIILATIFITGEYRRGLIRTTLAASPRRGWVLAAKAVVVAAVSFVVGVVAATVSITVGGSLLRSNGNLVYSVSTATEVRMIVGMAGVLAVGAVMALALGTILRHAAGVIVGLIALFVLPEFLAVAAVLPPGPGQWLLRLTPAAGFAVEQSLQVFSQVTTPYWPQYGYYPLSAWAGFLVLCVFAAAAYALANYLLARRDV
jgi:ABC-type transport system involved in multi-copper enzyme maturation permease subunit